MNNEEEKKIITLLNVLISLILICLVLAIATFVKIIELI